MIIIVTIDTSLQSAADALKEVAQHIQETKSHTLEASAEIHQTLNTTVKIKLHRELGSSNTYTNGKCD